MKKLRKVFSLILVLSLALSCGMASAADIATSTALLHTHDVISEAALFASGVSAVPVRAISILEENGADIQSDTMIEVLAIEGTTDTAICVTNTEGNLVEKNLFVCYTEDENGDIVVDNSFAEALEASTYATQSTKNFSTTWNKGYVMSINAYAYSYFTGVKTYYRPYMCSFSYTDSTNAHVTSMKVEYLTDGWLYKFENGDFADMNTTYPFSIVASEVLPTKGVTYSQTRNLTANYYLYTDSGSPLVGSFANITNVVNGATHTACIRLI